MKLFRYIRRMWNAKAFRGRRVEALLACQRVRRARRRHGERATLRRENLFGKAVNYTSARGLDFLFREIFVEARYGFEPVGSPPVIVDAGANIGMALLYFKIVHPRARVICFEPNPEVFALLQKNVADNRLEDVTLHPKALGSEKGSVTLFLATPDASALTSSIHPGRHRTSDGIEPLEVDAVCLSDYVEGPVDLLKLDVEGAEAEVLRDLDRSGKIVAVRTLIMEYHHHIAPGDDALAEVLGILERNGFTYQVGGKVRRNRPLDDFQDLHIVAERRGERAGR